MRPRASLAAVLTFFVLTGAARLLPLPGQVDGTAPGRALTPQASAPQSPTVDPACERYDDNYFDNPGRQSECQALHDLYSFTSGASWTNNGGQPIDGGTRGGWQSDDSYCFFFGIACRGGFVPPGNEPWSAQPQVVELRLNDNNLATAPGPQDGLGLPAVWEKLPYLTTLDLSGNPNLNGILPDNLTSLSELKSFHYDGTSLCPPTSPPNTAARFKIWLEGIPDKKTNEECGYKLSGLEVTQAVQNLANEARLVQGKATYVRAHVQLPDTYRDNMVPGVTAELVLTDTLTGAATRLSPINQGMTITLKKRPDRANLDDSFLFAVPLAWAKGVVEFEFRARRGAQACENIRCSVICSSSPSGTCKTTSYFEEIPVPQVSFVPIAWQDDGGNWIYVDSGEIAQIRKKTEQILPIRSAARFGWITSPVRWPAAGRPTPEQAVARIQQFSALQCAYRPATCGQQIFHGIIKTLSLQPATGIAERPGTAGVSEYVPNDLAAAAHEIAHNFGRMHSGCDPAEANPDPNFVPKDCTISEAEDGQSAFYGFESRGPAAAAEIYRPKAAFDVMGYRRPHWIAEYTWEGLMDAFGMNAMASLSAGPANTSIAAGTPIVLISGIITTSTNLGALDAVVHTEAAGAIANPAPGSAAVRFENAGGQELAAYSFEPRELADGTLQAFALLLPRPAGTARIVLLRSGVELAARTASANAPAVTLLSPNGGESLAGPTATLNWSASDADGDALSYVIEYSTDAGATWQVVDPAWHTTSYELNLESMAGSNQALIRVRANDGFHTGQDQSDSTFSVARKPPIAAITAAAEPVDAYVDGQLINLAGDAFDFEDGPLPATAFTWNSSQDGLLGSGASIAIEAARLSRGTHTITLAAQDSDGMTGTATITVTIDRPETITYAVNLTGDTPDANVGDGACDIYPATDGLQCTLRAAIQEANATDKWGAILLPAGTYRLAIPGSLEDDAASGDLDINGPHLAISGAGPALTIIDAAELGLEPDRVLDINTRWDAYDHPPTTVIISGVTIRSGDTSRLACGSDYSAADGAGIRARRVDITLANVALTGNTARCSDTIYRAEGGGLYVSDPGSLTILTSTIQGNHANWAGGGIWIDKTGDQDVAVTIAGSMISQNTASASGGGISADQGYGAGAFKLQLDDTIVRGNSAINTDGPTSGGGIAIAGSLALNNSTISDNLASGTAGEGGCGTSEGGGLYGAGELAIHDSTISGNTAAGEGCTTPSGGGIFHGGLEGQPTIIAGSTIVSNTAGGGAGIYANALLMIDSSTVSYNTANVTGAGGGGIYSNWLLTVTNSTLSYNTAAGDGGAVFGNFAVSGSQIHHNRAGNDGGGIMVNGSASTLEGSAVFANSAGHGGGGMAVFLGGDVDVVDSVIYNNAAVSDGGGIYVAYTGRSNAVVTVRNSTLSGNSAANGGGFSDSGGISVSGRFFSDVLLESSTVAGNTARESGGGVHHLYGEDEESRTMTLGSTLLAGNTGGNCGGDVDDLNFVSNGYNLSSDATCTLGALGDKNDLPAQLGPLQDNGGDTLTHALAGGSPAIDMGPAAGCPATDQRLFTRPNGSGCDTGAYEYMPSGADLWVNPPVLVFNMPSGGSQAQANIGISNPGESPAAWTAEEESSWIALASSGGSSMPGVLGVSVNSSGLADGVYVDQITIASPVLGQSPQRVQVTMVVGTPTATSHAYLPLVLR